MLKELKFLPEIALLYCLMKRQRKHGKGYNSESCDAFHNPNNLNQIYNFDLNSQRHFQRTKQLAYLFKDHGNKLPKKSLRILKISETLCFRSMSLRFRERCFFRSFDGIIIHALSWRTVVLLSLSWKFCPYGILSR